MHRLIFSFSKTMAVVGGLVLVFLIAITCLSVLGRILNGIGHLDFVENHLGILGHALKALGPINGDYELVEASMAFAIFAFLPWCQLNRQHAKVELFSSFFPSFVNALLNLLWEILFALALILVAWRLQVGTTDKMRYQETTLLLQMPVWWAFAVCAIAATIASGVAIYSCWLHSRELFADRAWKPRDKGAPL